MSSRIVQNENIEGVKMRTTRLYFSIAFTSAHNNQSSSDIIIINLHHGQSLCEVLLHHR
jgi:hypothetical protein